MGTANTRRPGDLPGKPPAGYHSGWDSQCRRGTAAGHLRGRDYKCRRRFSAGVPGASPPAKYTLGLPLPAGKGGGGMGERKQAKGGCGRRQRRQTTLWVPPTPAEPATSRASHPLGTAAAGIAGKQKGAPRGTQVPRGAPRAKKPGNLLNYLLSFLITRLS